MALPHLPGGPRTFKTTRNLQILTKSTYILIFSHCEWFFICEQFHISAEKNTSTLFTVNALLEKRIEYLAAIVGASLVIPRLISNTNIRHDYKNFFLFPLGFAILVFLLMGL